MAVPAMSSGRPMRLRGALVGDLLAEGLQRGRHHFGLEGPRRDGVDRDGGGESFGQVTGELVHGGLGRRVRVGLERRYLEAVDRPDVDDPGRRVDGPRLAAADQELGQMEDALDVEREHLFERGLVEVLQRGAPGGACVVDQYVEGVLARRHLVGQAPASASVERSAGIPMQVPFRTAPPPPRAPRRPSVTRCTPSHRRPRTPRRSSSPMPRLPPVTSAVFPAMSKRSGGAHRVIVPVAVMARPMPARCAPGRRRRRGATRPRRGRSGCGACRSNRRRRRRRRRSSSPGGGGGTR